MTEQSIPTENILEYWARLEFFLPHDTEEATEDKDSRHTILGLGALGPEGDARLPWHGAPPVGGKPYLYDVYLGLFDKRVLTATCETVFGAQDEYAGNGLPWPEVEKRKREGTTCFAKVAVSADGNALPNRFALSTFPWALHKLASGKLAELDSYNFDDDETSLRERVLPLLEPKDEAARKAEGRLPGLDTQDLATLCDILFNWAGWVPSEGPKVAICWHPPKDEKQNGRREANRRTPIGAAAKPPSEEDDEELDQEERFPLLNSFFIRDLHSVSTALQRGLAGKAIRTYLGQETPTHRQDVYSRYGEVRMLRGLAPGILGRGRWPAPSDRRLGLMQQFAVDNILALAGNGGMFSVNGPPGTGKTTMLRDVIAEIVVARARVLAGLRSPEEAFAGTLTIDHQGKQEKIKVLREDLTGFEMVVASSNNTAVENLSRELPAAEAVAPQFDFSYLAPVACKFFAKHDKENRVSVIAKEQRPWGLISVPLGKMKNRDTFTSRCFFNKNRQRNAPKFDGSFLAIWDLYDDWKREPGKATSRFQKLREQFKRLDAELLAASEAATSLCSASLAMEHMRRRRSRWGKMAREIAEEKACWPSPALMLFSPGRAVRRARATWRTKRKQTLINEKIRTIQKDLILQKRRHASALGRLRAALGAEADALRLPEAYGDAEERTTQCEGMLQGTTSNKKRARLFATALRLHEAWLAAALVANKERYSTTLFVLPHLVNGKLNVSPKARKALWQNFFLMVPVVSTTFASVAGQFSGLGAESLGWLFIDEAGQAMPQAAAGAIWRARNVAVVGDPLQIEPVCPIPQALAERLGGAQLGEDHHRWSPQSVSAQALADRANPIGGTIAQDGEDLWIGCPLRVHRRCQDPMFSISNAIAYDNKMLHGNDPAAERERPAPLGPSAWIDLGGRAVKRQYVEEQGRFALGCIRRLFLEEGGGMPDVYVISPFRRIAEELRAKVRGCPDFKTKDVWKWAKDNIGTVHTFQGKENDTVLVVLGTDAESPGSSQWAAQRPNILNVALTRAKNRVYVIGERGLWSRLRFFCTAAQALPVRKPTDVLPEFD